MKFYKDDVEEIANQVGLKIPGDLETFKREEMQEGETLLMALERYKQELIDAGVDLSKLVNESLQEGTGNTLIEKFITSFLNKFSGFELNSDGNWDYRKGSQDAAKTIIHFLITCLNDVGKDFGLNLNLTSDILFENLTESAVKDVAIDIEAKEKELKDLESSLHQLKSYNKKECGAGGQFDSVKELEDEITSVKSDIDTVKKEIDQLKAKVGA